MQLQNVKAGDGWRADCAGLISSAAKDRAKQETSS